MFGHESGKVDEAYNVRLGISERERTAEIWRGVVSHKAYLSVLFIKLKNETMMYVDCTKIDDIWNKAKGNV